MAKSGIDYFPLDVCMDSKMELIEAEYGVTGFGVVVHLLQEIYGKEGYYIEWTTEVALLFARKYGLGGNVVSEIVEASIKRGMFDKEIYDKYRVLTSRGIQKRYFEAVSRRKSLKVDDNILLVNVDHFCNHVDISLKNVNIFSENANISKQSKVEKSKVEKSKVEKSNKTCFSDDERLNAAVIDFIEFRKTIKNPMTDKAISLMLNKLDTLTENTEEKIEIINQSILNGWQGVFPVNRKNNERRSNGNNIRHTERDADKCWNISYDVDGRD